MAAALNYFRIVFFFIIWLITATAWAADAGFTEEEQAWIKAHPVITLGADRAWPPYEFEDSGGVHRGIAADFMALIADKTGLRIQVEPGIWSSVLAKAQSGAYDGLSCAVATDERKAFLLFSDPYLSLPVALVVRRDNDRIHSADDIAKVRIAINKNSYMHRFIAQHYPKATLLLTRSNEESLEAVSLNEADAYVGNVAVADYIINKRLLSNLKVVGKLPDIQTEVAIAINRNNPLLATIMHKAVASISEREREKILSRWFTKTLQQEGPVFTPQERTWMKEHPVIRVGGESDWPPFDFVNSYGDHDGIASEYLALIEKKTGLKFDIETGKSWSQLLAAFQAGAYDLLPAMFYAQERAAYTHFSQSYLMLPEYLYTRSDYPKIDSLAQMRGKRIAVVQGYEIQTWLKAHYPDITMIPRSSPLKALQAVIADEADGFIGDSASTSYVMENAFLTDLKINTIINERNPVNLYMGAAEAPLASLINKVLDTVTPQEHEAIQKRWYKKADNSHKTIILSKAEKQWLQTHPVVTYSEVNWQPMSIIENGEMQGIMRSYIDRINEATGLQFQFVPSGSWPNVLAQFKDKTIDLVPGIGNSDKEAALGLLSLPYDRYPLAIVTRSDIPFIEKTEALNGHKVAVPQYYTSYNYLLENHPGITIIPTKNINEALTLVASGEAYAFLGHMAVALYHLEKLSYTDLKIAGLADFEFVHHFLIQNDAPELRSIVNKVFETINEQERKAYYGKWVTTDIKQAFDYKRVLQIAGLAAVVIVLFVFWNRLLARRVAEKTAEIRQLLKAFDKNVIASKTDTNGQITYVSEAFETISGYRADELIGKTHDIMRVYGATEHSESDIYQSVRKYGLWRGELQNRTKSGQTYWVDTLVDAELDHHGTLIGYNFIRHDITDKKAFEALNETLEQKVEARTEELKVVNDKITDSIEYAALIQHALIPSHTLVNSFFDDHFALWHPKDTVGGDIYLFQQINEDEGLLMVIDCTGHGVPGAFMTIMVKAIERQLVANLHKDDYVSPARLLELFNRSIKHILKQESTDSVSNAGFDGGILYYNKALKIIRYAGAETPLFYIDEREVKMIRGDRHSIGYKRSDPDYRFTDHEIDVSGGLRFYLTTDGYYDQNGGPKGFPFGKKRLRRMLAQYCRESFADQQELILDALHDYQGNYERNDDIMFFGAKINEER